MIVAVQKLHSYPTGRIEACETALIVFAAEFGGANDAAWIAEAGLRATCVDDQPGKLDAMRGGYPHDWEFVCADAYEFARKQRRRWDVVSLDPFTHDFDRCAANIDAWCRLARRTVVVGTGTATVVAPPDGWEIAEVVRRSDYQGGVFWTVLERV